MVVIKKYFYLPSYKVSLTSDKTASAGHTVSRRLNLASSRHEFDAESVSISCVTS